MTMSSDDREFCFVYIAYSTSSLSDLKDGLSGPCATDEHCGLLVLPGTSCDEAAEDAAASTRGAMIPSPGFLSVDDSGDINSLVYSTCLETDGNDLLGSSVTIYSNNGELMTCGEIGGR